MHHRNIFLVLSVLSLLTSYFIYFILLRSDVERPYDKEVYNYRARSHNFTPRTATTTSFPVPCDPEVNVAYIKTHKTASTTLQTIFNRFGFFKNLSFIFNNNSASNGHFDYLVVDESSPRKAFLPPIGVAKGSYENYTNYNMIAVHVRYYRDALRRFMVNGTRFITIIREPAAQWESAFNHFEFRKVVAKAAGMRKRIQLSKTLSVPFDEKKNSSADAIREFLRRPDFYHATLKTQVFHGQKDVLWHYAKNNQVFDLGLDTELSDNETLVNSTIDRLEQEFDFVVINEFFDESLVVIKKILCWTFKDILYLSKNQRPTRANLTDETVRKIREWNRADVLLYDRFNRTLWKRIADYGPAFDVDLREFRRLLNETKTNCSGETKVLSWQGVFRHTEYFPKGNSSIWCTTIAESKAKLFARVFQRQKPPSPKSIENPQPPGHRKGKAVLKSKSTSSMKKPLHSTSVDSKNALQPVLVDQTNRTTDIAQDGAPSNKTTDEHRSTSNVVKPLQTSAASSNSSKEVSES